LELQASNIFVTQRNATGTANESMTVVVDGPAFVTTGASITGTRPTEGTVATLKNGHYIHVWSTGTAGTATITIKTLSGGFTATETVKFYGSVTGLAVTTNTFSILRAGGYATAGTIRITATDALGIPVKGLTVDATSGNSGVVLSAAAACTDAVGYVTDGVYSCTATSAAGSVSGNSATVTYSVPKPLSTTGETLTTTQAYTIGGTVATEVISLHATDLTAKSSFSPGEAMVVAVTAKDSAGNPVYDGAASPALTANKLIGGTNAIAAGTYTGGLFTTRTLSSGVVLRADNFYAPVGTGDFTITGLSGNATASRITVTGTVTDDAATAAATAASDAAAEATDAANAATDAANAAAEAADAATAAAQDAADAVAALSTSVTEMVNALKKQITSLTNLVIKIQKKVRA
jgi:protocatechuate 3,4-dioxygenase beta subunit